ncbi:GFA family protein [Bradyrhizobium liaoningense]|uniref:GFA family protein n=1 Tax=Bradyrhizobium liaoningense TaxID=43992 RepID=UPI001BA9F8DE|nr:GFA family protein [Bradyrhizobium liaoningense]MBR0708457.1 GFA family protein [Bradyrhizobium liaoningense]
MIDARCSCGAVSLSLPGPTRLVAACHCIDCQRRTGAPFGVGAFYPVEAVTIFGAPKEYVRAAASGGEVRFYFCSDCGSTVCWKADNLPDMIGVAVGAIADPDFPAPARSVFEQSKHAWVEIGGSGVAHFEGSSARKSSG